MVSQASQVKAARVKAAPNPIGTSSQQPLSDGSHRDAQRVPTPLTPLWACVHGAILACAEPYPRPCCRCPRHAAPEFMRTVWSIRGAAKGQRM